MSTMDPLVTIITPSYNQGKFIERTIRSILAQDYPHIEHIVVDGGSTDETLEVLRKYEGRLRWISEKDSGQSEAINKGFRMARGEILTWLNSDDTLLPGAVTKAVKYFSDHADVMMIYGEGYIIDENDNIKQRFPFTEPKFDLTKLIYQGDYILQQSTFYRKDIFSVTEMLHEDLHYGLDWDLFIRIGKRFPIHYVPEYFGCIREHGQAKTAVGGKKRFRELVELFRRHGVLRFPPAYFNYAWDAYGKPWFPETQGQLTDKSRRSPILDILRRVGLKIGAILGWQQLRTWHADGWVERKSIVVLPNFNRQVLQQNLTLEGVAQSPNLPITIELVVNRKVKHRVSLRTPGKFECRFELAPEVCRDDSFHVEIFSNRSYNPAKMGLAEDGRDLAFIVKDIRVVPA